MALLAVVAGLSRVAVAAPATVSVSSRTVSIDTRPDLDGIQTTATAVKDVATGVVSVVSGFSQGELQTLTVRGRLVGPGLDETVFGAPNGLIPFPRLAVAGTYTLTDVRLVNASSGATVVSRDPLASTVTLTVVDELLVTQVSSRALTLEEIEEAGIIITDENFTAVEFSVGLTIGSEEVEIDLPVLLPGAGIDAQEASRPIFPPLGPGNARPFESLQVPNLSVAGFSAVPPPEIEEDFNLPPVTGLIIIPGNIAFLNQFFSVMVVTLNTGPEGSGLEVQNARARARLPVGADGSLGTGDDPLRLAATNASPDGIPVEQSLVDGSGNDTIAPQTSHEAEYLVEGLREGTHPIEFDILGDLFVPALGETVPITGQATGVVQVRNPTFSISLAHPDVVRDGEDYSIFATVTNTSNSPANLFEIGLNTRSLSGTALAEGATDSFSLEQLLPGQAETFEFHLTSRTTGEVTGTVFLADDSINGSFILTTGVGDTGIPLSPDTLVLPDVVDFIPDDPDLVFAVVRMLGQAYSVATAPSGTLPPNIDRIRKQHVFDRGIKLAQVGLHARFGESFTQGALDTFFDQLAGDYPLLERRFLDPIEGLDPNDPRKDIRDLIALNIRDYEAAVVDTFAYDKLRRAADAGNNLADVVGLILADAAAQSSVAEVQRQAAEWFGSIPKGFATYASRGEGFELGLVDSDGNRVGFDPDGMLVRELALADYLSLGASGAAMIIASSPEAAFYDFELTIPLGLTAASTVSLTVPDGDAMSLVSFDVSPSVPAGTTGRARWVNGAAASTILLELDYDGDGVPDEVAMPTVTPVLDSPPTVLGVYQWGEGRFPQRPPIFETGDPLGRLAAVLFSEPVDFSSARSPSAFRLVSLSDEDRADILSANTFVQPDNRLVFVQMDLPFGPFIPRAMNVRGIRDLAGGEIVEVAVPVIETPERGAGGVVRGRILRPDGTPVPLAQIKYIQSVRCEECFFDNTPEVIVATTTSDLDGRYELEYVLQNRVRRDFRLEVVDPLTDHPGETRTHIRFDGQQMRLDVIIRGFGFIFGTLIDENGDPVTDSGLLAVEARNLSTGETATSFVQPDGSYGFPSAVTIGNERINVPALPVGNILLEVVRPGDGATAVTTTNIPAAGVTVEQDLLLVDFNRFGRVEGRVVESDGVTGAPNVLVQIAADVLNRVENGVRTYRRSVVAQTFTDESGRYAFDEIPTGDVDVRAFRQNTYESARAQSFLEDGQIRVLNLVFPGSGATVVGTVFDASGLPLENATVAGGPTLTTTDASGNFIIDELPLGNFEISAQPEDGNGAGRVRVTLDSPDDEVFVAIFIEPLGTISGTVRDAEGFIQASQEVQLWTEDPEGLLASAFTDASGNYSFVNFPVAEFTVRAVTEDYGDGGLTKTAIRFQGDVRDADIQFRGLGSVRGVVQQSNGTPAIADVIVRRNVWRAVDGQGGSIADNYYLDYVDALADEFGQDIRDAFESGFRSAGVPPVFFLLNAESGFTRSNVLGPGGEVTGEFLFRDSITGGPFTVIAQNAFAGPAQVTGAIPKTVIPSERDVDVGLIVLQETTGEVSGTVFMPDGVTPVGADVAVDVGPLIRVTTDENGRYRAPIVPTGGVTVIADTLTPATPALLIEDAITDDFETLNVRLYGQARAAVPPGSEVVADLRLQDVAGVSLTVVDSVGVPVPGAVVTLNTSSSLDRDLDRTNIIGGIPGFKNQTADGNGQLDFFPVIEGRYSIAARHPTLPSTGAASGQVPVNPENGTVFAALVQLGAVINEEGEVVEAPGFGAIEGTVFKADGTPLSNPSEVVINTNGVRIVTTSDPNGFFMAELVPEGFFRVDVFEPATARTGQASGQVLADQTTTRNVTLVGLGAVSGVIYSNDGLSTITGARVTLFPSGNFTAPLVTQADLVGSYGLPGVPLGPYTVEAFDNFTGLEGSNTGLMVNDGDELSTDVYLDPSASIMGTVYAAGTVIDAGGNPFEADGTTPCTGQCGVAGVDVQIRGREERTLQTGPDGRFDSGLYLPLGSYTLTARIPGQGTRQTVALTFDGEAPDVALVLEGLGTVEGVVLDSTGTTPVDLAQVTLQSRSPYSTGNQSAQTDATGRFFFNDVSVGTVVVSATKTVQGVPLGGSQTRSLTQNGEVLLLEGTDAIVLQESAGLVGRVLQPDGVSAAAGTVVSVDGGLATPVSVVADTDGRFEFLALPLDAYALSVRENVTNAVAFVDVNLNVNGETRDVGDLVLDGTRPTVLSVTPADGATDVPVDTTVEVIFSEEIDATTVNAMTLPVRISGVNVAGSYVVDSDPLDPSRSRVTFTPSAPLPDLSSVRVRVLPETRDFDGNLTSIGVTDLAGFGLESQVFTTFYTADTTPAEVVSLSPADAALEVPPTAVLRIEFNEAIQPGLLGGVTLARDGVPVSGATSFALDDRVIVFVPTDPLAPNGMYEASVVGPIVDLVGNSRTGVTWTFRTIDTAPPTVADITFPGGASREQGSTLEVTAIPGDVDAASVEFFVDGTPRGRDSAAPFTRSIQLPLTGPSVRVGAIASDLVGNLGVLYEEVIPVVPNAPAVIDISFPTEGRLVFGPVSNISAQVSDATGIQRVEFLAANGAYGTDSQTFTGPGPVPVGFTWNVPTNLPHLTEVTLELAVIDTLGARTTRSVNVRVEDRTAPSASIVSPSPGTSLRAGESLVLVGRGTDRGGLDSLRFVVSGAFDAEQQLDAGGNTNTVQLGASFVVPSTVVQNVPARVELIATDVAGNESTATLDVAIVDEIAPSVAAVSPADGATLVPGFVPISVIFDEIIDRTSVTLDSVLVSGPAGPIDGTFSFADGDREAIFSAAEAFVREANYIVTVTDGVTDLGGNSVAGFTSGFDVTSFDLAQPVAGISAVEGDELIGEITIASTVGIQSVDYLVDGVFATNVSLEPFAGVFTVPPIITDGVTESLDVPVMAVASYGGAREFRSSETVITVYRALGDADLDTMTNALERAQGTDPFVDDADLDPDADGLTNLIESLLLTDPFVDDTDGDGLGDGEEDANANGTVDADETDPLNPDTDSDGMNDGVELANRLDPLRDDADEDADGDGISNIDEINAGSDPQQPDIGLNTTGATEPVLLSGRNVFNSVFIAPGTTVRAEGDEPLEIISTGSFVIAGTIDVSGRRGANAPAVSTEAQVPGGGGVAGGGDGGFGAGFGSDRNAGDGVGVSAGTGGGFDPSAAYGGYGGGGGFGSPGKFTGTFFSFPFNGDTGGRHGALVPEWTPGSLPSVDVAGSGGGGGGKVTPSDATDGSGGGGGAGGGAVYLEAPDTIDLRATGLVNANGGRGGNGHRTSSNQFGGGGGGGAGGYVWVSARRVVFAGTITAIGGPGGAPGGLTDRPAQDGGVGRVRIDAEVYVDGIGTEGGAGVVLNLSTPPVVFFGTLDYDRDGLTNAFEAATPGLAYELYDTDGDGLSDGEELDNGLDPLVDDAMLDSDGDGTTNAEEIARRTDPLVSDLGDVDGDGLGTEVELRLGTNPYVFDTDGDGLSDGVEDANGNGERDLDETSALLADSDFDGLSDAEDSDSFDQDLDTTGLSSLELTGTLVFQTIYIAPETTVSGVGPIPLQLVALDSIVVDGIIDVSGGNGSGGTSTSSSNPGSGGSGRAGGGAGGPGSAVIDATVGGVAGKGPGAGAGAPGLTGPVDLEDCSFASPRANRAPGAGHATVVDTFIVPVSMTYGTPELTELLGGSGGSGGGAVYGFYEPDFSLPGKGGPGGGGGGVIVIRAANAIRVSSSGRVLADGGDGGLGTRGGITGSCETIGSGGAAGSGGAILLRAATVDNQGQVSAVGGLGAGTLNTNFADSGDGGLGRIRVDAETLLINGAAVSQSTFNQTCDPDVGFYGAFP